jgi:sporulation protein YtfJ
VPEHEHPIQGLMKTAMTTLKDMVDVNTIVGEAVEAPDGSVIVPISRVSFGFAAGGGEYGANGRSAGNGNGNGYRGGEAGEGGNGEGDPYSDLPFAGGSGGGVTINPVGFLVVGQGTVRMLPVDGRALFDRALDMAPSVLRELTSFLDARDRNHHSERG